MAKYFITGSTGTIGKSTVGALIEKGEKVIAATRNPKEYQLASENQTSAVYFDYKEPDTFKAVNKADAVFLLGPPLDTSLFELVSPFLDYLEQHGPNRVVYLSANGIETESMPFHVKMEQKLKDSQLDWTILRPGFFMQNFGNYEHENIEQRKIVFAPAGDGKTAFISTVDIGAAAASVLTNSGHSGKTYVLTGDKLYSYYDAAEMLSEVTGETISYPNPGNKMYRLVLKDSGAPDFIAEYMIDIYDLIRKNKVENISEDLENLIGRKPESLKEVLIRDFKK
ncbi:MAG: SDR family oxidoreductase [Bacteroidota bacterium]